MQSVRRGVLAFAVVAVLLTGAVGPAVANVETSRHGQAVVTQPAAQVTADGTEINVTQEFGLLPATPGTVRVTLHFEIPDRILTLRTMVPDGASVTATGGFSQDMGREYSWSGGTQQPTLTYRLAVNESVDDARTGNDSGAVAVDAGEWALFQRPPTAVRWENYATEEPIEQTLTTTTDGPGATGEWVVFLGDHETYERSAHNQQFRLVVPSNANMTAAPPTVLDSLADASNALRVGDRDGEVVVIAAPTDGVRWGVRGLQTGDADLWVRDVEPVDSADNAWVHEYVHTRQAFSLDRDLQWFREASASYYAALLSYEQGHVRYDGFSERLRTGANSSYDDVVLANRSTWHGTSDYDRGALVTGKLDRQIRTARGQNRTFQAVFRAINENVGRTTLAEFLANLWEHGDAKTADAGERYVNTTQNLSMWNETAHVRAFGDPPARIGFQLPNGANGRTYRIAGPYRNVTLASENPPVLVPGEQLRVGTVVHNSGNRSGNFTASLAVNGSVADRERGSIGANETVTTDLTHRFETPGRYRISVGGDERTVEVRESTNARVTALDVTSRQARQGDSVGVRARVDNGDDVPARMVVVFRRDDGLLVTEVARVGPDSATWVNASMPMSQTATTTVSVAGAGSTTIAVRAPPAQTTDDDNTPTETIDRSTMESPTPTTGPETTAVTERPVSGGAGPGFGWYTVTVASAVAAAVALLRRRQ